MSRPSVARLLIGTAGIVLLGLGGFNLLGVGFVNLLWVAAWLAAGLVLHDGFLAPSTAVLGKLAADRWSGRARRGAVVALVTMTALTLIAVPMMIKQDSIAGNSTLLGRNYAAGWAIACGLVVIGVIGAEVFGRIRTKGRREQSTASR